MREISWTTKAVVLILSAGFLTGILYLVYSVASELRANREQSEKQQQLIAQLEKQLGQTSDQLGTLEQTNKDLIRTQSLAQNVKVEYGNSVCLIVGVYQLVDRSTGRVLRYPDPQSFQPLPYEAPSEGDTPMSAAPVTGLTTVGNGSPVEYDFIGTGFHVGGGFIVTNRHVLQPWTEDDVVKSMMTSSNGRARIRKLLVYFPNNPEPFPLTVRQTSSSEDLAVGSIDITKFTTPLASIPLDDEASIAATVGKTVVTMGYPNGPDRLLAMVDDEEAKSINRRFGNSRENLVNFLAQTQKIQPLTTQGAITDLDARRIVHDAEPPRRSVLRSLANRARSSPSTSVYSRRLLPSTWPFRSSMRSSCCEWRAGGRPRRSSLRNSRADRSPPAIRILRSRLPNRIINGFPCSF